jgi:hypothetical protein
MNRAIALLLLCGVLVSVCAHAGTTKVTYPRWVIILTVTDRTTGAQLEQLEVDSELRFDDPIECKSIVAKVGRIPTSDHFAAVLKRRKVGPLERDP